MSITINGTDIADLSVPELREHLTKAYEIIEDLVGEDDEPEDQCWFDHHGYCQAHGWMSTERPCPVSRGRDFVGTSLLAMVKALPVGEVTLGEPCTEHYFSLASPYNCVACGYCMPLHERVEIHERSIGGR